MIQTFDAVGFVYIYRDSFVQNSLFYRISDVKKLVLAVIEEYLLRLHRFRKDILENFYTSTWWFVCYEKNV